MFGQFDDMGFVPSYYLAEIKSVSTDDHTCSIHLLKGLETYDNVKIMTDIGNFSLPKVGDICITFWDNRNIPLVIGFYPVYHKMNLEESKYYNVLEGERMWQSEFGQKLIFNKRGEITLTNWTGQGLEVYQNEGVLVVRSNTIKQDTAGVDKRSGFTQRYSPLARKDAQIYTTTGLDAATIGATPLVEDATIIKDSTGILSLYENKIGNYVVAEDPLLPTSETKTVPTSDATPPLPLRSQTKYFSADGLSYLEVSVDISGNVKIDIPSTMALTKGVSIEGLASNFAMNFLNIAIGSTTTVENNISAITINVEGTTAVTVNAPAVSIGTDITTASVDLGPAIAKVACNNLPTCLFTGTVHASQTIVKV